MELIGRQVLKIKAVAGEHDYKTETKMAGKKYRIFASPEGAFVAESTDAFCKAFDAGRIYSIDLKADTEGQQSMVGFTTIDQELNMAKTEVILKAFTVENYVAGKLSPEQTIALD